MASFAIGSMMAPLLLMMLLTLSRITLARGYRTTAQKLGSAAVSITSSVTLILPLAGASIGWVVEFRAPGSVGQPGAQVVGCGVVEFPVAAGRCQQRIVARRGLPRSPYRGDAP